MAPRTALRLGVVGTPAVAAASLSPRMMTAAFEALGIDAVYEPLPIEEGPGAADELRALFAGGRFGVNVTMPFKLLAAQLADVRSERVEHSGAANTLWVGHDGRIHAEATDGIAVVEAVRAREVELVGATVALVGAGGAAVEAAVELAQAGVARIDLWNRTPARAQALAARLHEIAPALDLQVHDRLPIGPGTHVVLGCVPADAFRPQAFDELDAGSLVIDLAYRRDGGPTPMMVAAAERGAVSVDGREILVRQGGAALRTWFDVEPPIEVMTRAVR